MSETAFSGPLATFTSEVSGATGSYSDKGWTVMSQRLTLTQDSTTAVDATFHVPANSTLLDIIADTTVAWDSATSAVLTVGQTSAGTEYASEVDVTSAGRVRPTFTATQLGDMDDVGSDVAVVATITPTGATTAGTTIVTLLYIQNP